jgi:hypothetical protein
MFTVDLFLNDGFLGDNQQVRAIQTQLIQKYEDVQFATYQDNDAKTVAELSDSFTSTPDQKHIFILSGSHGFEFIQKNPNVQAIIKEKKPIVIWFGHQNPGAGVQSIKEYLNIVALPQYMIDAQPDLQSSLSSFATLIGMQSVPNTLTPQALSTAKEDWNLAYPAEMIKPDQNYIGIFLGGDAPMPDGTHLYWDEKEAHEQGRTFGLIAQTQFKHLLITNGPRTGKFDPQSPDPKKPDVRAQHTQSSPLDSVSTAFLAGLKASNIPATQYQFFDFKFDPKPGQPPKSAYKAIIATLQSAPHSIAIYSGESISYAEIAHFIPFTYAFETSSMNDGHRAALNHFKHLNVVRTLDLKKPSLPLLSAHGQELTRLTKMMRADRKDTDNIILCLEGLIKPKNTPGTFTPLLNVGSTANTNVLPNSNSPNVQVTPKTPSPKAQPVGII